MIRQMSHSLQWACRLATDVTLCQSRIMRNLLTARDAAELAQKSRSQIHRDAQSGRLAIAQEFPGYNGPRLFDEDEVRRVYGIRSGKDDAK